MRDPDALRRVSAKRFQEWYWYEQIEPFGELREDFRAALVAMHIANTGYDLKKRGKPYDIEDFLLKFSEVRSQPKPEQKQATEEQIRILNILTMMYSVDGVQE
jgi:hypothetical protein